MSNIYTMMPSDRAHQIGCFSISVAVQVAALLHRRRRWGFSSLRPCSDYADQLQEGRVQQGRFSHPNSKLHTALTSICMQGAQHQGRQRSVMTSCSGCMTRYPPAFPLLCQSLSSSMCPQMAEFVRGYKIQDSCPGNGEACPHLCYTCVPAMRVVQAG